MVPWQQSTMGFSHGHQNWPFRPIEKNREINMHKSSNRLIFCDVLIIYDMKNMLMMKDRSTDAGLTMDNWVQHRE